MFTFLFYQNLLLFTIPCVKKKQDIKQQYLMLSTNTTQLLLSS